MSGFRCPPATLLAAVAANANRHPIADHQRRALGAASAGRHVLLQEQVWVLDQLARLPRLSDAQLANLERLEKLVEARR